jgi:hypothetical protein
VLHKKKSWEIQILTAKNMTLGSIRSKSEEIIMSSNHWGGLAECTAHTGTEFIK